MDQRLAELVEELTTSGESRLEPGRMKELKKICKYGPAGAARPDAGWGGVGAGPRCLPPKATLVPGPAPRGPSCGLLPELGGAAYCQRRSCWFKI